MNILSALKEGTRPLHDKLENELDLLRSDFTLDDYCNVLKRFYGFYLPLEPLLKLDTSRLKIPRLKNDLAFLGISLTDIPLASVLPLPESESHRAGIMYVIEGSTLGGQVLTKHFKEKFNLSPENGLSFFSGYGVETFSNWKKFQEELLIFSESKSYNPDHVIEAANTTFRLLGDWLIRGN